MPKNLENAPAQALTQLRHRASIDISIKGPSINNFHHA